MRSWEHEPIGRCDLCGSAWAGDELLQCPGCGQKDVCLNCFLPTRAIEGRAVVALPVEDGSTIYVVDRRCFRCAVPYCLSCDWVGKTCFDLHDVRGYMGAQEYLYCPQCRSKRDKLLALEDRLVPQEQQPRGKRVIDTILGEQDIPNAFRRAVEDFKTGLDPDSASPFDPEDPEDEENTSEDK